MSAPRGIAPVAFTDRRIGVWRTHLLGIGRSIANARTRRGWTEETLAGVMYLKGCDTTAERIGELERGALPTALEAGTLERSLGLDPDVLVRRVAMVPASLHAAVHFTTAASARARKEAESYLGLANQMMWAAARELTEAGARVDAMVETEVDTEVETEVETEVDDATG